MEIFANHAHIYQDSASVENGSVDYLRRLMDECEISRAVTFAPLPPDYLREHNKHQNVWLAEQIKNDPRFVGFGVIDFALGHLQEQVQQIFDLGFKGIKVHPAEQRLRINSIDAFKVYSKAEELGLFMSFHTGVHWYRIADYNQLLYDEVAFHFPNLKFTMEHVGGYSFFTEALAVMVNSPNVYAGITSVFDTEINKFWYLSDDKIRDLLWMVGAERCIFGLDSPWNDAKKIKYAISKIKALDIPEEQIAGILGGNLKRVLNIK